MQHVKGEGLSTRPRLIPRIVSGVGSLQFAGLVYKLRDELDRFWETLDVLRGESTESAALHRDASIDLWFPEYDKRRSAVEGRYIMQRLPNGAWVLKRPQHHCSGAGCCPLGKPQSIRKFKRYVTRSIVPRRIVWLAQHKWTGLEEALRYFGRMQSPHRAFEQVYSKVHRDIADSGGIDPDVLSAVDPNTVAGLGDQGPTSDQLLRSAHLVDQKRENANSVTATEQWIGESIGGDLAMTGILFEPIREDIQVRIQENGVTWGLDEHMKAARGEERQYRLTNAASGKHSMRTLRKLGSLVEFSHEGTTWLPFIAEVGQTAIAALEALRMAGRMVGGVKTRFEDTRNKSPLNMFRMLPQGALNEAE